LRKKRYILAEKGMMEQETGASKPGSQDDSQDPDSSILLYIPRELYTWIAMKYREVWDRA
jgi:hypothetical protein